MTLPLFAEAFVALTMQRLWLVKTLQVKLSQYASFPMDLS
jgi:hypothetical protein